MKTSPVNSVFQTQHPNPTATQLRACAPKDILTQGTSSSSSDGFLMCMLKPIGRFFQSIFSFFKYLLCCCSSSYQLPKLTPELLKKVLNDEADDSDFVQKSDYCVEVYVKGEALASFEIVPFGKSFGIQLKRLGEKADFNGILETDMFGGSSAYLIKDLPEDKIEMAKANGFIKEGDFWVRKGSVEGVISSIPISETLYIAAFLKEDNTFETVNIQRNGLSNNFDVSGLEMCPGRVNDLVTWAKGVMPKEITLEVASDPAINAELKEAGFVTTDDKTFTLELKTGE